MITERVVEDAVKRLSGCDMTVTFGPETTIAYRGHCVDFSISWLDMTLPVEEFRDRYLKPAVANLLSRAGIDHGQWIAPASWKTGW